MRSNICILRSQGHCLHNMRGFKSKSKRSIRNILKEHNFIVIERTDLSFRSHHSLFVNSLQPCYLKDWEMHVQFKVHGSGKKNLHGDGIAIWYTKDRLHPGTFVLSFAVSAEVSCGINSVKLFFILFLSLLQPCLDLVVHKSSVSYKLRNSLSNSNFYASKFK